MKTIKRKIIKANCIIINNLFRRKLIKVIQFTTLLGDLEIDKKFKKPSKTSGEMNSPQNWKNIAAVN